MIMQNQVVLNIGRDIGHVKCALSPERIGRNLDFIFQDEKYTIDYQPNAATGEHTAIVRFLDISCNVFKLGQRVYALAELLSQDCIAVKVGDNLKLVGPESEKWGPADPRLFLS